MNIRELDKHKSLGVDVDGTLIEHPRSHILQKYIVDNHRNKNFHIITFRSHGLEGTIDEDLWDSSRQTGVPISLDHFASIQSIPYELWERHQRNQRSPSRDERRTKGGIILPNDSDIYHSWKGEKCRELGCTALIDDMEPTIGQHCAKSGIHCLNPDHY